jgi:GT2 family glycosyltransferase
MDGVEMLDFSLRARNQGWVTYLDPSLFVFCSSKREVNLTEADFYFSNKHGKSIGALR